MSSSQSSDASLSQDLASVLTSFRSYQESLQSRLSAAQEHICDIDEAWEHWTREKVSLRRENEELRGHVSRLYFSHEELSSLLLLAMDEVQALRQSNICLRNALSSACISYQSRGSNESSPLSFISALESISDGMVCTSPARCAAPGESGKADTGGDMHSPVTDVEVDSSGCDMADNQLSHPGILLSSSLIVSHISSTSSSSYHVVWRVTTVNTSCTSLPFGLPCDSSLKYRIMLMPDPVANRIYFRLIATGGRRNRHETKCTFVVEIPEQSRRITADLRSNCSASVCICDLGVVNDFIEVHATIISQK